MKMNRKIFLIFLVSFQFCNFFPQENKSESETIYRLIEEQNIKSFPPRKPQWVTWDTFRKGLTHRISWQLNPQPRDKRNIAFDILDSIEEKRVSKEWYNTTDPTTWNDLNLFCGQASPSLYLGSILDRASTEIGKVCLLKTLALPLTDIQQLEARQKLVKEFITNENLFTHLDQNLATIKESENFIFPLWDGEPFKDFSEDLFFKQKILKKLNKSHLILDISNRISHLRRISMLLSCCISAGILPVTSIAHVANIKLPESVTKLGDRFQRGELFTLMAYLSENKWALGLMGMLSAFFSGVAVPQVFDWEAGKCLLEKLLHFKLCKIAAYINAAKSIEQRLQTNPTIKSALPSLNAITNFFGKQLQSEPELKELIDLLETSTFKSKHSILFSYSGRIIRAYQLVHEHKEKLEEMLMALGEIDAYFSVAKLYKEFENKPITFSFAEFVQSDTPCIHLKDFWNPFIDPEKVVVNSITLGNGNLNNALITGPNAGGKSTIIKAIAINLILAQTFGIASAQHCAITPFSSITTHLNIVDDIGAGNSLFKTEVIRAQNLVDKIENLKDGQFCFTAMDEVFNGTTPAEGQAAAYSIAQHISQFPSSICMIATHFARLTELEQATDSFTNYKVSVTCEEDGTLAYPFKLEKGDSHQHVAFDMLRLEGIDNSIVTQAQDFLDER